jgi:natural product biosynthesis luciferase-like monooxygenase protein
MTDALNLIVELQDKGLKLEVDAASNQLKVRGNTAGLTNADKQAITTNKAAIIEFLSQRKAIQHEHTSIPRVPDAPDYALSSAQLRLWVLSQFEATNAAYNIPAAFEFNGPLDRELLQWSFLKVIGRHEILRTLFKVNEAGDVRQSILSLEELDFQLGYSDLSGRESAEEHLDTTLKSRAVEPFDLASGPLLQASLYKLNASRFVLFFNMHHAISDGWSMELFLKEIMSSYQILSEGKEVDNIELPIQYKDYADWQRKQLKTQQQEGHRAYWMDKMAGEIPALELPTSAVRPAVLTYQGASIRASLTEKTTASLQQLVRSEGATLFMGLLAGLNALFQRYSGQDDLIIGSPIAGREHADLQGQIGVYINILALRNQVDSSASFMHLFQQVKENTLQAYTHQSYPFDALVGELDLSRDASRSALFDILMVMQNSADNAESWDFSGMTVSPYKIQQSTSKFDMTWSFREVGNRIDFIIEYNRDLYSETLMEGMTRHFEQLLSALLDDTSQPIHKAQYLSETEKAEVTQKFNKTALAYADQKTVVDLFEERVKQSSQDCALVFEEEQMTYLSLNEKANRLAQQLRETGVQRGELIGIYAERSLEMMVGLLAILKSGAAYVPIDPEYPQDRISYVIEDAGIKTILTHTKSQSKITDFDGAIIPIDLTKNEAAEAPNVTLSPDDLAYVIYTSGSTGKPKGVLVEHGNVVNFFAGMDQKIGVPKTQETFLAVTTISFDISVLELFWTLVNGFKVVIQPSQLGAAGGVETVKPSTKKMDFSLFYFASEVDEQNKYKLLIDGAKFGDQNGFSAIWTPERHFHEFGGIYPNPSIAGAAIATITENIQIRSGSCVLPLHNPIRVAEEWSVVDNLSNGRVGLSFASGWVMNDFLAFSPNGFDTRHKTMYDGIDQVQRLWKGDSITLENPTGPDATVQIFPKPIQKELPIWVTAAGNPETFRSAGKMGANLLTHLLGQNIDELEERVAIYREARKEAGHEGEGCVTLMIHTFIDEDVETVREKVREPFRSYLRHATGLIRTLAKSTGQDLDGDSFSDEDLEALLDHAFDRYFETAALFGTPESCLNIVNKLSHVGVNELGCLVDFGLEIDTTLDGLQHLNALKDNYAEQVNSKSISTGELLAQHKPGYMQCTPSALKKLLMETADTEQLKSLKTLMIGGEAFSDHLAEEALDTLNVELYNMYGPTETTIWSAVANVSKEAAMTIGKPIANTQLYILDEHLNVVPIGVAGEIYIGGKGVVRGYLNQEELTAERFISAPEINSERLYKTGDVGKWTTDGTIQFLGRTDGQVKIRGHRIELGEIAAALRENPIVSDAVLSTTQKDGLELVAYIVGTEEVNAADLRKWLSKTLPQYMIPAYFVQLEEFPETPNGKVDKNALPNPDGEQMNTGVEYQAPRNETEEDLLNIWTEVLQCDPAKLGVFDNFFELGGNSLNAVKLIGLIKQKLSVKLDLQMLFYAPTIEGLATEIETINWATKERPRADTSETIAKVRI